ncbi:hypothetical protein AB1286_05890 [Trinickia sp. NRRL B-1857]|uniref:hypothetical protein n=1 Tax=Trinickia sp. NRRL B-1857 TaxID=3162879 RepID=UPI003D278C0A
MSQNRHESMFKMRSEIGVKPLGVYVAVRCFNFYGVRGCLDDGPYSKLLEQFHVDKSADPIAIAINNSIARAGQQGHRTGSAAFASRESHGKHSPAHCPGEVGCFAFTNKRSEQWNPQIDTWCMSLATSTRN